MTNIRPLMKRVCAYILDLFIVLIVASLISSIPALNKNMDDYQKTYEEYEEKYNDYTDYLTLLEESYKDEEINEEEYTKLTDSEQYQEIISSKYDDNKISEKEYTKIVSEVNENFDTLAADYVYILSKEGVSNSVITLICTLLYFGVIQYFLKGQTIGKKILKLKVVSASDKKINILNYILRSLIVNDILLNGVGITFLLLSSKSVYTSADNVINILISIVEAIIIFLVLTREDQRGLHDLLFNTKVISTEETKEEVSQIDNKKILEAEIEESKEEENNNGEEKPKKGRRKK